MSFWLAESADERSSGNKSSRMLPVSLARCFCSASRSVIPRDAAFTCWFSLANLSRSFASSGSACVGERIRRASRSFKAESSNDSGWFLMRFASSRRASTRFISADSSVCSASAWARSFNAVSASEKSAIAASIAEVNLPSVS